MRECAVKKTPRYFYRGVCAFYIIRLCDKSFSFCLLQCSCKTDFIDRAHTRSSHFQSDPFLFSLKKETLLLNVRLECALSFDVRVRHFIPYDCALSGDLANF